MKILLALHGMRPEFVGGSEIYVERLARALSKRGHDCAILCGSAPGVGGAPGIETTPLAEGIPVHRLRRPDRFGDRWMDTYSVFAERAIDGLLAEGFDVLHIHHWKRLTPNLARLAQRHGIGSVISFHDLWPTCPREYRLLEHGFCREKAGSAACPPCVEHLWWESDGEIADRLRLQLGLLRCEFEIAEARIAPSEAHARALREFLGPLDVEVLAPAGTDLDRSVCAGRAVTDSGAAEEDEDRDVERDSDRFPIGPLRIGFFGHLVEFKGPHVLLRAIATTRDPARYRVDLFGDARSDDRYLETLEAAARGLAVRFHGAYAPGDIARSEVDLAVIPSLCHESYSIVLDEVLAAGIPALVSDAGALPDRVGGHGAVFRSGSASELARQLDRIVDEPDRLARWRDGLPIPMPDMEDHVDRLAAIYDRARDAGPSGREDPPAPYEEALAVAQTALDDRQRRLEALAVEAGRAAFLQDEIERHQEVQRRLGVEGDDLRSVLREVEAQLEEHRKVVAETARDLAEHRKVGESQARQLDEHREVSEALRRDLEGHRKVLEELRGERERLLENAESLVAQVRERDARLEEMSARVDSEGGRAARLADEVQATRAAREAIEADLIRARESAEALQLRVRQLDAWTERVRQSKIVRLAMRLAGVSRPSSGPGAAAPDGSPDLDGAPEGPIAGRRSATERRVVP